MKTPNLFVAASILLLAGACIPSVNPFYTAKDLVLDSRLPGEWQEKGKTEGAQVWKFEPGEGNGYKLFVTEKGDKQGEFAAHLFKLKQDYFLDVIPRDCAYATNQADLVAASMFPGHLLARVTQIEPELKLAFFDFDWLQKHLDEHPKALAHHKEVDRIVLTASTSELQQFVLKHLGPGELFGEVGEMVRKTSSASAAPQPPR